MDLDYTVLNKLEQKLGNSYYILDIEKFKNNYYELINTFTSIYPNTKIAYSYKTNYIPTLCKIINDKGGYAEVVSEMEYDLALKIGVNPKNIIVNGPYKPDKALEKYLIKGSIVNLDNYTEFYYIKEMASKYSDQIFNIGIRCNFELSNKTISRFGFDITNEYFYKIVKELIKIPNIRFIMLHCHYPYRDLNLFKDRANKMIGIYKKIDINNIPFYIDIGGGLGGKVDFKIKQQLNYQVADYNDYATIIATKFSEEFSNSCYKPILMLEPGTALVANTMQYVCKIVDIKSIRNEYIAISSGSKINYHRLSNQINLPLSVYSNNENKDKSNYYNSINISGYTCMEDDYLYKNYCGWLYKGDFLVFDNVGSYSIVYKPPFILPNVPIIALNGLDYIIVKEAETFNYIFQTYKFEELGEING